jgi:hypothetical protein
MTHWKNLLLASLTLINTLTSDRPGTEVGHVPLGRLESTSADHLRAGRVLNDVPSSFICTLSGLVSECTLFIFHRHFEADRAYDASVVIFCGDISFPTHNDFQ